MKRFFLCLLTANLVLIVLSGAGIAQTKRALLIGINTYQPAGTSVSHPAGCTSGRCRLSVFKNLNGPVNDVQSMVDLITGPHFGFPPDQVAVLTDPELRTLPQGVVTIPPAQTSRAGILSALEKYLVTDVHAGDTVLFYFAGHGSLRLNTKSITPKIFVTVDGKSFPADNTIVPGDAYQPAAYDITDHELQSIFHRSLDKGVNLVAIFDSCHSGSASRGADLTEFTERALDFDPRDLREGPDLLPDGNLKPVPAERKGMIVFSASQIDQSAKESRTVKDGEVHGAFTSALVQALQVLPAGTSSNDVYKRVRAVLESSRTSQDQEPMLDGLAERKNQPLFGGATADDVLRTAVIKRDQGNRVVLDIGQLSGVGPGSEFQSLTPDSKGNKTVLRVDELKGITRSIAIIESPANAEIAPGDIFERTKIIPPELPKLAFWMWPSTLTMTNLAIAAEQVRDSGVTIVQDPAEEPWTDILSWEGAGWVLRCGLRFEPHSKEPRSSRACKEQKPIKLGAKLTTDNLKKALAPGAKLWVNMPPAKELAEKLRAHETHDAVVDVTEAGQSDYLLAGTLQSGAIAYTWFHRHDYERSPRPTYANDHTPGCSTDFASPYPVRTDWVQLNAEVTTERASALLNEYALRLAKVHGWLTLDANGLDASDSYPYRVALKNSATGKYAEDITVLEDHEYVLVLRKEGRDPANSRWIYIMDIDCTGAGSLVYPLVPGNNRFPNDADSRPEISIQDASRITVGEPYGIDTMIVIATGTPLPDPSILNFEGVHERSRSLMSPLEQLLGDVSSGTRGPTLELPTDWSVHLVKVRSVPAAVK